MPREIFPIGEFNKGTITVLDETDQPADSACSSENLDPTYVGGLRGRKADEFDDDIIEPDGLRSAHAMYTEEGDLVLSAVVNAKHQNGSDTANDADAVSFDGTSYSNIGTRRGELIPAIASARICGTDGSDNDKVYFVGRNREGDNVVTDAELTYPGSSVTVPCIASVGTSDSSGELPAGKYFYRASLLYEGVQDGPLSIEVGTVVTTGSASRNIVTMDPFNWAGSTAPLPRVSHFRIWRAFSTDTSAVVPDTPYRLIASVDVQKTDYPTSWTTKLDTIVGPWDGTTGVKVYDSGEDQVGDEYENIAGLSSASTSSFVQYRIGHLLGQTLFVGHCTRAGIAEAELLLFRSMVGRPDMFDWANEYLRLPYIPTAITSYEGRLFVFSDHHVFRVNPIGFYIEDQIDQAGTFGPRSVIATDAGLIFANSVGAYAYNGQVLTELSLPLSNSWKGWVSREMQTVYLPDYTAVMFLKLGTSPSAWVYSLNTKRWDYWTFAGENVVTGDPITVAIAGAFNDADGVVYLNEEGIWDPAGHPGDVFTKVRRIASSASERCSWSWTGPQTGLGEPAVEKKFYGSKVDANGTSPTVTHALYGESLHSDKGFKRIQYTVSGDGTDEVRSIGVMFRRMVGKR